MKLQFRIVGIEEQKGFVIIRLWNINIPKKDLSQNIRINIDSDPFGFAEKLANRMFASMQQKMMSQMQPFRDFKESRLVITIEQYNEMLEKLQIGNTLTFNIEEN